VTAHLPLAPEERLAVRWVWVDLRLAPVAAAVWAVSAVAPFRAPAELAMGALVAIGLAVVLARRRIGAGGAVALAVLAGVAVAAAAGAVRGSERAASPLGEMVGEGRSVEVVLELDGDPYPLRGPGERRVIADATVTALDDGAAVRGLEDAVLLFAPAERWEALLPGQRVRVRVTASAPRAGDDVVAVLTARGPPTPVGEPGAVQRAAGAVRAGLASTAARVLDPRPAGLLPGLVVGDTGAMDPVLEEDFRRAGLAHLTAVSGANVAIVLMGVLWPLRRRALDRRLQAVVAGLALVGFVVLARPEPSVIRAAAMGAVTLLALASGRPRAALPALGAAVCVLLLVDPGLARDPGFALSVAATAGIVLLAPGWSRRLRRRRVPRLVADALAVSAAAGLVTAPIVAGLSGTVSLVSVPANLLAAPAVAPATVLGLTSALVGVVVPPAGDALAWTAGWPTRWLVLVAERASGVPDAATGWPAGSRGAVLLTGVLLAGGWAMWRFARLRPLALAALVGLVVLGWPVRQVVRGWPPPDAVVVACDVGQGDALVVPTAPGEGVLVDAGPDVGAVDRCLDRLGIDALPLVLLSHLDADHAGGLAGALSGRDIGVVATGTLSPADDRVPALETLVRRVGARRAVLVPGDHRTVDGAQIEVLAPAPDRATASAEANDLSMVARVTYRGLRILFTGDLSAQAESRILASGVDLRADVLKVPHHGSADADPEFLSATGARVALISVGADNTYGHPTPRLLTWLSRAGMRVHRTDQAGDLAVAGTADDWGVAERGSGAAGGLAAAEPARATVSPATRSPSRRCRCRVTRCSRAGEPRGTDLTPAGGHGRRGVPALARGRGRPRRRPRPARGSRDPRAERGRPADRGVGGRAGALPLRRAPSGRRLGSAGGCRRPHRVAGQLREGPGPRAHPRHRPLRREAERGTGQGLHRGRGGTRRVPQT
jgi:competence protein ComEC